MSFKYSLNKKDITVVAQRNDSSEMEKQNYDSSTDAKVEYVNLEDSADTFSEEDINSQLLKYKQLIDNANKADTSLESKATNNSRSIIPISPKTLQKRSLSHSLTNVENELTSLPVSNDSKFSSGSVIPLSENTDMLNECTLKYTSILDVLAKYNGEEKGIYREDERVTEAIVKGTVSCIPSRIIHSYAAHSKNITSLNWCANKYSYLFLSASSDGFIKIWDLCRKDAVTCITDRCSPYNGLKAAEWSCDGKYIVSGGFNEKANVYDVQSGKNVLSYDISNYVFCLDCHPYRHDHFLCGTRNAIFLFDMRVNTSFPVQTFISKCEDVLDVLFVDENDFICSTSTMSYDSSDRTIMVWDYNNGTLVSNQIFSERHICHCLKLHPTQPVFAAQTSGNFIALFSSFPPYKIKKKFEGHKVSKYAIECDFSPDGQYLASGDAYGKVRFYNFNYSSVIYEATVEATSTNKKTATFKQTSGTSTTTDETASAHNTDAAKLNESQQCATGEKVQEFKASVGLHVTKPQDAKPPVMKPTIAINRVKWHPLFPSTLITSSWDGYIQIWE